jgi:DNA ligase-associated metallophosphoesterase
MNALVSYSINENDFVLTPDRTLFWEKQKTLIIADLHIGKTGHFRKAGIPVPQKIYQEDLQRLFTRILFFKAEQLIIAGDLSHSKDNKELELFKKWRNDLQLLQITLVNGNHDILEDAWYKEVNIYRTDKHSVDNFSFYHDPAAIDNSLSQYSFAGHLHPAITIRGKGRQALQFPCFYFGHLHAILPAFSRFSGFAQVQPKPGEHVFAIVEKGIMQVQ